MQIRSLSSPNEIAQNEDVLRIFLMACDVKSIKLSVIGLSCLQKLISHDAVNQYALKEVLSTLKDVSPSVFVSCQILFSYVYNAQLIYVYSHIYYGAKVFFLTSSFDV